MNKKEAIDELTKMAEGYYPGKSTRVAYENAIEIVKKITKIE